MTHPPGGDDPFRRSPEAAFSLLGNETRIEILHALWAAYDPHEDANAASFSDLYEHSRIEDTGNFNYHLDQLLGHFVTETDEGYQLTEPGFRVARAIVAGTATEDPTLSATPLDRSCLRCDGTVEIAYDGGTTKLRCTDCEGFWSRQDGTIASFSLPPEGLRDRDPDEILDATIVYALHRLNTMDDGVCPACGGPVDATLTVCDAHDAGDGICDAVGSTSSAPSPTFVTPVSTTSERRVGNRSRTTPRSSPSTTTTESTTSTTPGERYGAASSGASNGSLRARSDSRSRCLSRGTNSAPRSTRRDPSSASSGNDRPQAGG